MNSALVITRSAKHGHQQLGTTHSPVVLVLQAHEARAQRRLVRLQQAGELGDADGRVQQQRLAAAHLLQEQVQLRAVCLRWLVGWARAAMMANEFSTAVQAPGLSEP